MAQADIRAYGADVRSLANDMRNAGTDAKGGLQASLQDAAGHLALAQEAAARFRAELSGHKAEMHEAGISVVELGSKVKELAVIFGVGLGVERLVEGLKQAAEWGERIENKAAAIGVEPIEFANDLHDRRFVGIVYADAQVRRRGL